MSIAALLLLCACLLMAATALGFPKSFVIARPERRKRASGFFFWLLLGVVALLLFGIADDHDKGNLTPVFIYVVLAALVAGLVWWARRLRSPLSQSDSDADAGRLSDEQSRYPTANRTSPTSPVPAFPTNRKPELKPVPQTVRSPKSNSPSFQPNKLAQHNFSPFADNEDYNEHLSKALETAGQRGGKAMLDLLDSLVQAVLPMDEKDLAWAVVECFEHMSEGKKTLAILRLYDSLREERICMNFALEHGMKKDMARTLADSLHHALLEKGRRKLLLDIVRSDHDLIRAMLEYEPDALAYELDVLAEEEIEGWEAGTHDLPPTKLIQELCDVLEGRKTPEDVPDSPTTCSPRMRL